MGQVRLIRPSTADRHARCPQTLEIFLSFFRENPRSLISEFRYQLKDFSAAKRMPSVCAKPAENNAGGGGNRQAAAGGGGAAAAANAAPSPPPESSLNAALAIVEKKVRNLEKRKVLKLDLLIFLRANRYESYFQEVWHSDILNASHLDKVAARNQILR